MADRSADADDVCESLPWDSDFFGFPVARTTRSRPDEDDVAAMLAWCEEGGVRCLYHSADPESLSGNAAVASVGFRLVDIRHEMELADIAQGHEDSRLPVAIRRASPQDTCDLVRLARTAFRGSRFARDPGFPQDRVSDMYERWLTNAFETGWVFVAQVGETLGGFITCDSEGTALRIGLLAVSEELHGSAYGGLMVRHATSWARQEGLASVRVVTQGSNIPALRTYEAAGFRTTRVSLWYHRWF